MFPDVSEVMGLWAMPQAPEEEGYSQLISWSKIPSWNVLLSNLLLLLLCLVTDLTPRVWKTHAKEITDLPQYCQEHPPPPPALQPHLWPVFRGNWLTAALKYGLIKYIISRLQWTQISLTQKFLLPRCQQDFTFNFSIWSGSRSSVCK